MIADTYSPSEYSLQTDLSGESEDFFVTPPHSTPLQHNFCVQHTYSLQLWGQLLTPSKLPLYKAKVKLIEIITEDPTHAHQKVAETTTDESGFYYLAYETHLLHCYYLLIDATNPNNNQLISLAFNPCAMNTHCNCDCTTALQPHLHDHTF